jgi:hypothetical protein
MGVCIGALAFSFCHSRRESAVWLPGPIYTGSATALEHLTGGVNCRDTAKMRGSFVFGSRMTAKNEQRQVQQQIPYGNDSKKSKSSAASLKMI